MTRAGDVPWLIAVLTLPPSHRRLARARKVLQAMKRAAVACVRSWAVAWAWHGVPVETAGCCTIHPEGDSRPGSWAPHFNVMMPALALDEQDRNRKGRFHQPPEALDDLRRRWERELERFHELPPFHVQVHYQHAHGAPKQAHAARYFGRHFAGWQPWAQAVSWFGWLRLACELPPEEPTNPFRCHFCGGTYRTIGPVRNIGPRAPP